MERVNTNADIMSLIANVLVGESFDLFSVKIIGLEADLPVPHPIEELYHLIRGNEHHTGRL